MKEVFISVRGRVLVNVEALNMTESIGNYVKHRKAPVLIPEDNGYSVFFVPAVSGETLAHAYQSLLAEQASNNNLPICKLCNSNIFLKSTDENVLKYAFDGSIKGKDKNTPQKLEEDIIKRCTVEDIGGFLYAEAPNVKRTSNFFVGYMIPVKESLKSTLVEPQLHTRYALGTGFVSPEKGEQRGQMIYYVELSSAVYTFSFDLSTKFIGRATFWSENVGNLVITEQERIKRIEASLDALAKLILEPYHGAKRTRFLPTEEWESLVIAVSDNRWTVPSPFSSNYIGNTERKRDRINENTQLFTYKQDSEETLEEVVLNAVNHAKERIKTT